MGVKCPGPIPANHLIAVCVATVPIDNSAMINLKRLMVPALGALLLAGCAGSPDTPTEGAICIISGEPAGDGPTAEFEGTTVHFCCKRCLGRWNDMDDDARSTAADGLK